ncbi:ABC transporter permease [Paraburkholderia caballeronis]|uniref:Sulfonate transport system permease protein n=1 Tax=Paraburkholderia caballeronis TaxID=416943 RepID=A0A1H7NY25_9BURK|nr:ABC transporter permease [Paraburkholderia caballeronis]PXW25497.1 sulfonate transport system permease protein [Paraburkholderia caballeronis]PXX01104.1 sulfonate transport system permease protein [Paraburkholderia caballeronis]RAJ99543.1 sulfonate transport system permease protein [Paraburkholderia caballeronis]SEE35016.1 sulfonate transport system permease protein [Paraburkholderia caballeronis]SEL27908.1 sulfonate transport system permease protein [Paraburkholderia caballeronis]
MSATKDLGTPTPPACECETPKRKVSFRHIDLRGAALPAVAIAIWAAISAAHVVKSGLLVSPADVLHTAWDQIKSGALLRALSASLAREASGFAIGTAAGLLLGCVLGFSRLAARIVGPSFDTFKQISLFAWIPLISVWFGLGDVAKVVFLSLAALLPVAAHTCDGIHAVPRKYIEVARALRYSRLQLIRYVILPAALPSIFTGLYLALIYSWLATLGAEYLLVAGSGIGNTLIDGSEQFRMDLVLFGIIVVGATGWALNALARAVERAIFSRRPAITV